MNRKQRRQQQSSSTPDKSSSLKSADDIPMSHPTRSKASKTLLEIAAERQAALTSSSSSNKTQDLPQMNSSNVTHVTVDSEGNIIPLDPSQNPLTDTLSPRPQNNGDPQPDSIPPWLDTLLLSTSLSLLHFTLETLAMHQYAQSLEFPVLIRKTLFTAFPILFLLIHTFHGHLFPWMVPSLSTLSDSTTGNLRMVRSLVYLVVANVAGCHLIYVTNDKGYYAVMKKAPGIGVLWVWAVLEMGVLGAVLGVVGPGCYAWWNGYGVL